MHLQIFFLLPMVLTNIKMNILSENQIQFFLFADELTARMDKTGL